MSNNGKDLKSNFTIVKYLKLGMLCLANVASFWTSEVHNIQDGFILNTLMDVMSKPVLTFLLQL